MGSKKEYIRFKYSEEQLAAALNDVRDGTLSQNAASIRYGIPKATLNNKLRNLVPIERKMGPKPILNEKEEQLLGDWIIGKAKVGFPMHPSDVQEAVCNVLTSTNRENPFRDNKPGRKWLALFLKRRPEIARRNVEIISKARAAVTEEAIWEWFDDLENYLNEEGYKDIFTNPNRIFNADELGMQFCPKTGKLLGPKKYKDFYSICSGPEKEALTVLCNFSASGLKVPPMLVVPYKRIPRDIATSIPDTYFIGRSDTGWMISEVFYEYVANCFYPWLLENEIEFPVILFLDGHKSHINVELFEFCKDKKILLYCLLPNATHILQPCDVSIFKPLKTTWKSVVAEYKQSTNKYLTKASFAPLFQRAFDMSINETMIQSGFRTCGLYPLNKYAVDISKRISFRRKHLSEINMNLSESNKPSLTDFQSVIKVLQFYFKEQINEDQITCGACMTIGELWKFCNNKLNGENNNIANTPFSDSTIEKMPIEFDDLTFYPDGTYESLPPANADTNLGPYSVESKMSAQQTNTQMLGSNIEKSRLELGDGSSDTKSEIALAPDIPENNISFKPETNEPIVPNNGDNEMKTDTNFKNMGDMMESSKEHESKESSKSEINKKGNVKILSDITVIAAQKETTSVDLWNQHLHWPKIETGKKRIIKPMPFAIVSNKWKAYHEEKENNKKEKAKAIEKRKAERKVKSNSIRKKISKKRKNAHQNNEGKRRKDDSDKAKERDLLNEDEFNIGDFVIVTYEGKCYPGMIENRLDKKDGFEISTMEETSLGNWKWPSIPDKIWYKKADILQKISRPIVMNSRGIFSVPEVRIYQTV